MTGVGPSDGLSAGRSVSQAVDKFAILQQIGSLFRPGILEVIRTGIRKDNPCQSRSSKGTDRSVNWNCLSADFNDDGGLESPSAPMESAHGFLLLLNID